MGSFEVILPTGQGGVVEGPNIESPEQAFSAFMSFLDNEGFEKSFEDEAAPSRPTGVLDVPKTGDFVSNVPIGEISQPELMQTLGLNPEDAPAMAKFNAALGNMSKESIKVVLEKNLGKPVEVSEDDVAGIIFRPQGEEKFRPFNIKEISFGDLAGALPEIGQSALEVGAAAMTFFATGGGPQSVPAALGVETVTAFGTEVAKMNMAQSQGQPISDSEIYRSALMRAGVTAITGPIGSFLQKSFNRITGRKLPADIERVHLELRDPQDAATLTDNIQEARDFQTDFNGLISSVERSDEALPRGQLTLGETTKDLGVAGAEEAATRKAVGSPLKELDNRNNAAVQNAVDRIFGPTTRPTTTNTDIGTGETIRQQAARTVDQETGDIRQQTAVGAERAADAERSAFELSVDEEAAAAESRSLIMSAQREVERPLKEQRNSIVSRGGKLPIELNETRRTGLSFARAVKKTNFKSLQKEAIPLIDEARNAGVTIKSVFERNPETGTFSNIKKKPGTLEEVINDLSNINETLRRGDLTPKQKRVLGALGGALRQDMVRSLRKLDPELLTELLRNNAEFAAVKKSFERGIIGRILKKTPEREGGGEFIIKDQSVIPTVLGNPRQAASVVSILEKAGNAGPRALNILRQGVLDWIQENPKKFVSKENSLKEILSKRQFDAIKKAKTAREGVIALQNLEKETVRQINKETDLKLASMSPDNMVAELFTPPNFVSFRRARDILAKQAPERLPEFDGAVKKFVMKKLSPNGQVPTTRTIDSILDPPQGQSLQAHLKLVFGDDYMRKLRIIRNFQSRRRGTLIQAADQGQGAVGDIASTFNDQNALRGLFRFSRVLAPPLSVRGRAFTAVLGIGRENAQRELVNAFVDPAKIDAMVKLGKIHWRSKLAATQLSILGLGHLQEIRALMDSVVPGSIIGEEQ